MTDGEGIDWSDTDDAADEGGAYLDTATGLDAVRAYKRRSYRLLGPTPGDRMLVAGCGTGDDALALAECVGPDGNVVGVDTNEPPIEDAQARDNGTAHVRFRVADVMDLPFGNGTFDACLVDHVLQHIGDPVAALAELCRVTRSGGRIVISDPDWGTCIVDAPELDSELTETLLSAIRNRFQQPTIGRRLNALVRSAELTDIHVDPVAIVLTNLEVVNELLRLDDHLRVMEDAWDITNARAIEWREAALEADENDTLLCSFTVFTIAGTN